MSAQAVRFWLTASQILLAVGILAVIAGAAGSIVLGSVRERLTLATFAARPNAAPPPLPIAQPDPRIATLQASNTELAARLATAEAAQAATARELAARGAAASPQTSHPGGARSLSPADQARLVAALKAVPGPPEVRVVLLSDKEAAAYGESIVKAVEAAGYRGQVQRGAVLNPSPHGVHLTIAPTNTRGAAIKYALEAVGIPVIVTEAPTGAFDAVIIIGIA